MRCSDHVRGIGKISCRFPSSIMGCIAYPINQVIQLVSHDFRIENDNNLKFESFQELNRWWWICNMTRRSTCGVRFQKGYMKHRMKTHVRREAKTKCNITYLPSDHIRAKTLVIQFTARPGGLDVVLEKPYTILNTKPFGGV